MFAVQTRIIRRSPMAWLTLTTTAVVVAVAVLALLIVVAFPRAVATRDARLAWRLMPASNSTDPGHADGWLGVTEYRYRGTLITRFDVASVTANAPTPAGLERLPQPGEFWASPALKTLLASTSGSELGDRFPTQITGSLEPEGLADPSELVAVIGQSPGDARLLGATPVMSGRISVRHQSSAILIVASGLAFIAVLAPLLTVIGSVTRVDVALRDHRLASLRLSGATPRQLLILVTSQAALGGAVGTGIGAAAFLLLRSQLAQVTTMGHRFFPSDLAPGTWGYVGVAAGAMFVTAAATLIAMRRLVISPLGVYRRHHATPPSRIRLLPLVVGLPILALLMGAAFGGSLPPSVSVVLVAAGFTIVVAGTLTLGPWITAAVGKKLIRWARNPGPLIAGRRLVESPRDHAALVAGVIVAVFGIALFYGLIPGLESQVVVSPRAGLRSNTMKVDFTAVKGTPNSGPDLEARIKRFKGVSAVTSATVLVATDEQGAEYIAMLGDCRGLAVALDIGIDKPCAGTPLAVRSDVAAPVGRLTFPGPASDTTKPGGQTALIDVVPSAPPRFTTDPEQLSIDLIVDPTALSSIDHGFFTETLYINLNDLSSIEQVRTAVLKEAPTASVFTAAEATAAAREPFRAAHGPLDVAAVAVLLAGGLSASVAGAGAILSRRQQLTGLRRVGIPLTTIRTVSIIESATPLAACGTLAAIAGLIVAWTLLKVGGVDTPTLIDGRGLTFLIASIAAGSILAASPTCLINRATRTTQPDPAN